MDTPEKKKSFGLIKPKQEMVTINVKIGDMIKSVIVPKQKHTQAKPEKPIIKGDK